MSDVTSSAELVSRLTRLVEGVDLSKADRTLAERCLRRLGQPLRLTVFGTEPKHAISLINLMIGQSVVSPSLSRARIQFLHGETAYARLQYRDGSQERIEGKDFRRLFEDNPSRVRIYVDLPVLKKLSILVATETNPKGLCADVDKTLPPADISIWAGAELSPPLIEAWERLPDRLRDHSYLVLSPEMQMASWNEIAQDFVEIMRVDPRRAQDAKEAEGGVDKVEFKESGGAKIVKTIKKEIDILTQASVDAAEVLLMRYEDQLAELPAAPGDAEMWDDEPSVDGPTSEQVAQKPVRRLAADQTDSGSEDRTSAREQMYSVPLGKLNSRSRLANASGVQPQITQRTVSMAIKNMPKVRTRPITKSGPKPRPRSRRSGPAPTPWGLGL